MKKVDDADFVRRYNALIAGSLDAGATVTLRANATALLVTLTTHEQGVWSENAFALPAGRSR